MDSSANLESSSKLNDTTTAPENDGSSCDEEQEGLVGWTKHDKFMLLEAIKLYSSSEIDLISMSLSHKTKKEIQTAINYYKAQISKSCDAEIKQQRKRKVNINSTVPLGIWVNTLADTFPFKELETETSTALRLIANYEKFPPPEICEGIDFKMVYHLLANALQGKSLQASGVMAPIIEKCLLETALTSKAFIKKNTFKEIIDNIDLSEKQMKILQRPTPNNELAAIRHLGSQRAYNPLNIGENHLKQSVFSEFGDL